MKHYDPLEVNATIRLPEQARRDVGELKRVANTKGGEYVGPCPFCPGGQDRFHLWPDHPSGCPQFWCRVCRRGGDGIRYVMERDGLTFVEVCREYSGSKSGDNGLTASSQAERRVHSVEAGPPNADWQNKAMLLIADCEAALWSEQGGRALAYLHAERGLTNDTIRAWRLGYCPSDDKRHNLYCDRGITIPWFDGKGRLWKVNVRRPAVELRYRAVAGSVAKSALLGTDRLEGRSDCFVTEGEFDAILLRQEVGDRADVLTLGSDSGRLADRWLPALLPVKRFWIVTDADKAGERAASYWLGLVGERGRRIYPPMAEKDVTDSWKAGADLRKWALGHLDDKRAGLEAQLEALLDDIRQCPDDERLAELQIELAAKMDEHQRYFLSNL